MQRGHAGKTKPISLTGARIAHPPRHTPAMRNPAEIGFCCPLCGAQQYETRGHPTERGGSQVDSAPVRGLYGGIGIPRQGKVHEVGEVRAVGDRGSAGDVHAGAGMKNPAEAGLT